MVKVKEEISETLALVFESNLIRYFGVNRNHGNFYDESYDEVEDYKVLPVAEEKKSLCEGVECDFVPSKKDQKEINDNFYDESYDDIDDYNVSSVIRGVSSLFRLVERDFVPFTKHHKKFKEILGDVRINPTRVEEVLNIFNDFMKDRKSMVPKVLLLTGPPGCGKRLLLEKIFKLFEFQVKRYDEGEMLSLNQLRSDSFITFLNVCNYSPIELYTSYGVRQVNVVFIDDLPNFIFEDPSIFYNKLTDVIRTNCKPIYVFSFTTSPSVRSCGFYHVFTSSVKKVLHVKHVNMSPVAHTFMADILINYIVEKNIVLPSCGEVQSRGNNKTLERIINLAGGDIRQGKIIIDFCATEDNGSPEIKKRKSDVFQFNNVEERRLKFDVSSLKILEFGRALKVDKFQALGKLFNAERCGEYINPKVLQDHNKVEGMLPPELANLKRPLPLKESIEDFVTLRPISTFNLLEYLFEHEIYFANDIKSLTKIYHNVLAMETALQADNLWSTNLDEFSYDIACRSLLYYNYKGEKRKSSGSEFYPITRPKSGYKSLQEINNKIKRIHNLSTEELTDIMRYKDLTDYLDCEGFVNKLKI
uniref:ATPase_AAA_core domain-containing protein n=1 Tax=Strongyloides papillosus TaxID=174720 RepID=A0A0N5B4G3_STREA